MIALYLTIISIGFLLAITIFVFDVRYWTKKEVKVRDLQFNLYKLRDMVLRLVAEDKITKDDPCFSFVYFIINNSIGRIREFTVKNLVFAAKEIDKEVSEKMDMLIRDILKRDNGLKDILTEYVNVIISSLIEFSPSVKIYLWISAKCFPKGLGSITKNRLSQVPLVKNRIDTYEVKKDLEDFLQEFSAA